MHWADRYLDKRIQQLKQETIRQNWDKAHLNQTLKEIRFKAAGKRKSTFRRVIYFSLQLVLLINKFYATFE